MKCVNLFLWGVLLPRVFYGIIINNFDGTYTLKSSVCNVTVNVSKKEMALGTILNLTFLETPLFENGDKIFALQAGNCYPSSGYIELLDNNRIKLTSSIFSDTKGTCNTINTEIYYTLDENHLLIRYVVETTDFTEFPDGLNFISVMSKWDSIICFNHTGKVYSISTLDTLKKLRWSFFPVLEFKNPYHKLWLISRNPYWSQWALSHSLNSKKWTVKSENINQIQSLGPESYSTLAPGHRLEWDYEIVLGNTNTTLLSALEQPLVNFSPFPDGYEQIITMIFDNLPFEYPYSAAYPRVDPKTWNYPKFGHDTTAEIGQFMVRLLEDHPQMKQGWLILLDYIRDSTWIRNPEEKRWWRAQGKYRNFLDSPEEYRKWLDNIENDSIVYGYEDQVHMGSHGLHHTPNDTANDNIFPSWEFQYYEPEKTESTFVRILEIYDSLGLTGKSLRFFRPPGFKQSAPLLYCLLKYGCKAMDLAVINKDSTFNPFIYSIYSPKNRLWLLNSTWSGDTPDDYLFMKDILQRGEYVLTAGHPYAWYDHGADSAYNKINQIFTAAEQDFPHLGYLFPDEFGDFLDELYDIHNISTSYSHYTGLTFSFEGKITQGESLIAEYDCLNYTLDGDVWMDGAKLENVETRGSRIYIVLPRSNSTTHTITIPLIMKGYTTPIEGIYCIPSITKDKTEIFFSAEPGQVVHLTVYNIIGQVVKQVPVPVINSNRVSYTLNATDNLNRILPNGVYILEARGNSFRYKTKLIILR